MTRETHACDAPAPLEPTPDGTAARPRRRVFVRRSGQLLLRRATKRLDWVKPRRSGAGARLMPTVRYRDVPAAIAWLCRAFGMEEHRVVAGADGAPCYAELTFGGSMLMVAPIEDTAFGRLMVQPDEIGGVETQVCYLFVEDAQAHYVRAKAAGAEIVLDIEDEANSGRGYSCRDPEGHVWNFGTYDPWAWQGSPGDSRKPRREPKGLAALLMVALAAILIFESAPQLQSAKAGTDREQPATEQHVRDAAKQSAKDARDHQAQVDRAALEAAERTSAEVRAQLAGAREAQEKAERAAAAVRAQLQEAQSAKEAADLAAAQVREHLAAAVKDAKDARAQAAVERAKHLASVQVAARGKRGTAVYSYRARSRAWCYNPNVPHPASHSRSRLAGFCRG